MNGELLPKCGAGNVGLRRSGMCVGTVTGSDENRRNTDGRRGAITNFGARESDNVALGRAGRPKGG